jgi:N-carbamoylputrescine amidase
MFVTITELPHEPLALATAWQALTAHTTRYRPELVLLPEFALTDPVWVQEEFDPDHWAAVVARSDSWLERLPELGSPNVVGTRPVSVNGRRFNEGYLWSAASGLTALRRKSFLPDLPSGRETRWFDRGDPAFPAFRAGAMTFGLNICTELWALESYAGYVVRGVQAILAPRATAATTRSKWLSAGMVAAVRSGAFCLSSNRVDPTGACGGMGWIIGPEGDILATTSPDAPFATVDIDLASADAARAGYPCNVFSSEKG